MSIAKTTNTLSRLPIELRNPIYDELLASGHTAIMRTNSAIYAETKARVYKQGVFRAIIGCNPSFHPQAPIDKVQNVHITCRLNEEAMDIDHDKTRLKDFEGTALIRKSLDITVIESPGSWPPFRLPYLRSTLCPEMRKLNGFKNVVIRLKVEQDGSGEPWIPDFIAISLCPPWGSRPMHLGAYLAYSYGCVVESFDGALGIADFDKTEEDHYLTFHPCGA